MQKRQISLVLVLLLLLLSCLSGCNVVAPIDLKIPDGAPVNYNNYSDYCYFDCRGDYIIRCNPYLTINAVLQKPDTSTSVISAAQCVQLTDNHLYFIRNNKLWRQDLSSGESDTIAIDVESFLVIEGIVYYISSYSDAFPQALIKQDLSTGSSTTLLERSDYSMDSLNYHNSQLYVITSEGLLCFDNAGTYTTVCTYNITSFPYNAQISGNFLLYDSGNSLVFVNLTSGERNIISISDSAHALDSLVYICNDNHIFASFQATKADGSFVSDIDHADNGLYHINPQTGEKTKLSSETFNVLYLFADDILIGNQNGKWVKINTQSGISIPL